MMTTRGNISPLGEGASEGAARRQARSREYRAQHDEFAPYRVIARAVILGRADKGITQEELGSAIGTTGSAISRIESGKRSVTLDTLGKLGAALEIAIRNCRSGTNRGTYSGLTHRQLTLKPDRVAVHEIIRRLLEAGPAAGVCCVAG